MMHVQKTIFFLLTLFLLQIDVQAQYSEDTPERTKKEKSDDSSNDDLKEKLVFGIQVGVPLFSIPPIDLSVQVGYQLGPKVEAGLQLNLISTPINSLGKFYNFYGGGMFARAYVSNMIFITGELSYMSMPYEMSNIAPPIVTREWKPLGLFGFGYKRGMFDDKSYSYGTIMYQVFPSANAYSPYPTPLVVKTGFVF